MATKIHSLPANDPALGYSSNTMSSSSPSPSRSSLPAVDTRLVAPESRYEVEDGRVKYVAPADEPHGTRHSKISALLEAHARDDFEVASDMLTRTSEFDDMAPDVSVFPRERDEAGGRKLEQLAFEVASTESLSEAGRKANKLMGRGVRRVFVIDVARQRAFEWSLEQQAFRTLERDSVIKDHALAAPLPIEALVYAAKADDAVAHALLVKQNPVLEAALATRRVEGKLAGMAEGKLAGMAEGKLAGMAEGKLAGMAEGKLAGMAEALMAVLTARGLTLQPADAARMLAEGDATTLRRWLTAAANCSSVHELLDG
jgi:Uma2 family endonuclease